MTTTTSKPFVAAERVAPLTAEQLAEIRAREAAATPGPWRWAGNVDHEDPRLTSGRRDILGTVPRERERGDRDARRYAEYLRECEFEDQPGGVERVGDEVVVKAPTWRHLTDDEIEQRVREEWLLDRWGQPAKDDRLAFVDDALIYRTARRLAVFEVCPEATDRDDPRVYRADIVGVRHPDAEFIAHARQDVADLLAEVEALFGGEWATQYAWHRDSLGEVCWLTDCPDHGSPAVDAPAIARRSVWFGPVEPVPTSDTTETTS